VTGIERPSWRRLLGILLAAAGVIYLISPARADASAGSRFGDLLILGSAFIYGCYIVLSKPLVETYGALNTITWIFIVATIPTGLVGAISLRHSSLTAISTAGWEAIIYIVLVPTILAYYLLTAALKQVPPSTVAVYIYLQPLIAFLIAPAILGEAFTWRTAFAAALVFAGVAITTRRRQRTDPLITETEISRP
jgi:drug/metabolite transporter (DMT)-like permease